MSCIIAKIMNKNTKDDVCPQYLNKPIRDYVDIKAEVGEELRVRFESGSSFTHELVLDVEENDYGLWIETTNKLWRFDTIFNFKGRDKIQKEEV